MIYHNRTRDVAAFWRFLLTVFLLTLSPIAFGQEGARRDEAIARLIQVQVDKAGSLLDENTLNTLIRGSAKPILAYRSRRGTK